MELRSLLTYVYRLIATAIVIAAMSICISNKPLVAKAQGQTNPVRQHYGLGWAEYRDGIRVVHLQGTPYDMGYQHGYLQKHELAQLMKTFTENETHSASFPGKVWQFFTGLYHRTVTLARLRRELPTESVEEMRGIVAGSDGVVDLDTLVSLQYMYEDMAPNGSSAITLRKSQTGSILHGYNLEGTWPADLYDLVTIFIYEPSEGEKFASIGWPGMVGVIQGINMAGLTLTYSSVLPNESSEPTEVPGIILSREALQHAVSLEEAYSTFSDWPRNGGAVVSVSEATNRAFVIEYNNQRIQTRKPEENFLLATTTYRSPALLPFTRVNGSSSEPKYERLKELLTAVNGQLTPEGLVTILRDQQDFSTRQEGFYENGIANLQVISSVVFDVTNRLFWLAKADLAAPAPLHRYVAFNLKRELGETTAPIPENIPASFWLQHPVGLALSLFRIADQRYISDDATNSEWLRAANLLEQVVAVDWSAVPMYWLGVAYAKQNQPIDAIRLFSQVAVHPQANPYWQKRALVYMGNVYTSEGNTQSAISVYKRALSIRIPLSHYSSQDKELDGVAQARLHALSQLIRAQ